MSRSLVKITRLNLLSREIRSDYQTLQEMLERTRRNCNQVVAETILLGTKLTEAKQLVGHGRWLEWLAEHSPEITERTARNYIRLANRQHVSDLDNVKSLRQAYLSVGIISAENKESEIPSAGKKLPVIEATVIESVTTPDEQPASPTNPEQAEATVLAPAPTTADIIKGKVAELMKELRKLDRSHRRKVIAHLKPIIIFYHRYDS